MKNFKHLFTALLLLFSVAVNAHNFAVDGIYYSITDATNKTVAVTYRGSSYSEYSNEYTGSVVIPESVAYYGNTYSVTSIGSSAFYNCSGLKSVVIGNSVTSIGIQAFYGCSKLTSVVIPNSVTSIGYEAFRDCSGLTSIEIPNSVTSIGSSAFYGTAWYNNQPDGVVYAGKVLYKYKGIMPENTSIIIEEGTLGITDYAFSGCTGLTSIEIPNSVTSIGNNAFYGCSGLTSVEIPNSVTSIGDYAFNYCFGLTSIVVEEGNTIYDSRDNCNAIIETSTNTLIVGCKSTVIPTSVTSIGLGAFAENSGLTSIVIPNSVTSIGNFAFYGCSALTSIEIPNSVTSIGVRAFWDCSGLTSIEIPNSVTSIGNYAFYSTAWYNNQPDGVVYAGNVLYTYKGTMSNNTSITIKDGTLGIAGSAFSGCSGLTSIEIPNSVTSIGNFAFERCSGLTNVEIPNSVTSIGNSAFYNCSGLTSIVIPNSVTSIGSSAFRGCSGLTSIEIPNSVTSIGSYAFEGCKNLKTVINDSYLILKQGSTSYGYIAYYADIVITPVNGINPITSLAELSNSSVYYIYQPYHSKGVTSWAVATDGDALKSNKDLNIAIDKNDTRQQFAILSIDGGVTCYLYHIATQMFVNLDGSLNATPGDAINFMAGKYENTFIAYFDNEHYVNVGGKQQMIIDDWDTPDGGNSCLIIPVGEFDPSNALEMFEGYTTEIDEMQGENEKVVYDLNGRRIVDAEYLEHGVYIVNGKKILVK